jgi:uncharacterized tellurite resistance protein B-like protein
MINRLFNLFENIAKEAGSADPENNENIVLAATALMLEVARSDQMKQSVELTTIEQVLTGTFEIASERTQELMTLAAEKVEAAHDLYQFTQVINDIFDYNQKKKLILAMWRVAFADGQIEAIEDHIIRRIAGLVHVAHNDFIQLKIEARETRKETPYR